MNFNFRNALLTASIPIQKAIQKMHPPETMTTVEKSEKVMDLMLPGDIVLSREAWHFTNIFIPGFWSHAAIYGNGQVVESVAPAVRVVDWRDWVTKKHNWCVLRPLDFDPTAGHYAFNYAKNTLGMFYDYKFSKQNKKFFCSELVYDAWDLSSQWAHDVFKKRKTFGIWTVTPDDFYNATKRNKFTLVYEHRDK